MICGCSSNKVRARCQPFTIEQVILTDADGAALVDDEETALLIANDRATGGSGFEFEFNRQQEPTE